MKEDNPHRGENKLRDSNRSLATLAHLVMFKQCFVKFLIMIWKLQLYYVDQNKIANSIYQLCEFRAGSNHDYCIRLSFF